MDSAGAALRLIVGTAFESKAMANSGRVVFQTKFGVGLDVPAAEQGNCTEASVATLLGIPLAEVPCFHGDDGPAGFWDRLDEFFASRGMYLHRFDGHWTFPCLYLAVGRTSRGTNHMVVMRDGELFHDPNPVGSGLSEMRHAFIAAPLDPATLSARPSIATSIGRPSTPATQQRVDL